MEPPPLIVTERFINPGFTGAYGHGAGVLVLVYGVVAIIKTPNDYHESIMASREYQDLLSHKDIWIPTVILANKALEILEFGGKLDKRTGRIIGRARKSGMLEVGSANDLFLNDALGFKDAFSTLGFRLLNECLVDMTLVHYKI